MSIIKKIAALLLALSLLTLLSSCKKDSNSDREEPDTRDQNEIIFSVAYSLIGSKSTGIYFKRNGDVFWYGENNQLPEGRILNEMTHSQLAQAFPADASLVESVSGDAYLSIKNKAKNIANSGLKSGTPQCIDAPSLTLRYYHPIDSTHFKPVIIQIAGGQVLKNEAIETDVIRRYLLDVAQRRNVLSHLDGCFVL